MQMYMCSEESTGQTMIQPCIMFFWTFALNMTLLLVAIKDLGMTDVFFSTNFVVLFCSSFLCLWHQFSAEQ